MGKEDDMNIRLKINLWEIPALSTSIMLILHLCMYISICIYIHDYIYVYIYIYGILIDDWQFQSSILIFVQNSYHFSRSESECRLCFGVYLK